MMQNRGMKRSQEEAGCFWMPEKSRSGRSAHDDDDDHDDDDA